MRNIADLVHKITINLLDSETVGIQLKTIKTMQV